MASRIIQHLRHPTGLHILRASKEQPSLNRQPRISPSLLLIPNTRMLHRSQGIRLRQRRLQPLQPVQLDQTLGHGRRSGATRPVVLEHRMQRLDLGDAAVRRCGLGVGPAARAAPAGEAPRTADVGLACGAWLRAVDVRDRELLARVDGAQRVDVVRQCRYVEVVVRVWPAVVVQALRAVSFAVWRIGRPLPRSVGRRHRIRRHLGSPMVRL